MLAKDGRIPYRPPVRGSIAPMPPRPPQFRWDNEAKTAPGAPTHCGNCGARLLRSDVPTADYPSVDVTCLYCSRVACELIYGATERPSLPPDEGPRKRGRPRKRKAEPEPVAQVPRRPSMARCPDCRDRFIQHSRARCQQCWVALRRARGIETQLVAFLRNSEPLPTRNLAAMLGCSTDSLRQIARRARAHGIPVVSVAKRYRLAGVAL